MEATSEVTWKFRTKLWPKSLKKMMKSNSKSNAVQARLAREQDLMRKMGERKVQIDTAKSLSNYEPGNRGWLGSCFCWVNSMRSNDTSSKNQSPLWGGDSTRVEGARDDGFYKPMRM